ncbi:MAG: DUF4277 domain-containing protein [Pirellulaceae bacterium]
MQSQPGLHKDAVLTKFVLGAHPIIEHFMELMRLRNIINTYMASDKRQKLDDGSVLTLLIHNILTTPHPLYEMQDWLKPLDAKQLGLEEEPPMGECMTPHGPHVNPLPQECLGGETLMGVCSRLQPPASTLV